MRAKLIRIGNSRGIRVSKLELLLEKGRLVIRPDRSPRQGWEEAFAAMAERGDDGDRDEWTW